MSNHHTQELVPLRISSDGPIPGERSMRRNGPRRSCVAKARVRPAKVIYLSKASNYRGSPTTRECSSFGSREL